MRTMLCLCVGVVVPLMAHGGEVPAPPHVTYPLIDTLRYENDQAARAAWQAKRGTAGVSVVTTDGKPVLKMPCAFEGNTVDRALWDRSVSLDLSGCQGIQLLMYCADRSSIGHFTFYFGTSGGWYAVPFSLPLKSGWQSVLIEKADARVEGTPVGWGAIKTIRISAWRYGNRNTTFYIHGLGLLGGEARIAVLRADSAARSGPNEERNAREYAKAMSGVLKECGLGHCMISDLDMTGDSLKGKSLVILPHNPNMPDDVAERLVVFLRGGGRLLCFYTMPEMLRPWVGIGGGPQLKEERSGQFASVCSDSKVLPGAPPFVKQRSRYINEAIPVNGKSRVAAVWHDEQGRSTGRAAIVVSENCVQMTHVLLVEDPAKRSRLLLAMISALVPDAWQQSIAFRADAVGRFGPFAGYVGACEEIRALAAGNEAVLQMVGQGAALRGDALRLGQEGKYNEALDAANKGARLLLEAYCAAQKPVKGEHRGFWCHSAFGVEGMTWDQAIKTLADNGFTAILPNMCWGGVAFYPSEVLPVSDSVKAKGDQIAQCLAACRKYGIACHVWKVNWNMGWATSQRFVDEMMRQGRTQVRFDGKPEARWLCPSNPVNQKLEIDAMVEVAKKYEVDGIHFDYIRYPGAHGCFCNGCRERFEKVLGKKVEDWPGDVRRGKYQELWRDFRRRQITSVVGSVAEAVRKVAPKRKISAAVFNNWTTYRDSLGQDWKLWCEKGYLDFVCPMDYFSDNRLFEKMVEQQVAWAGKVPCYPGIGFSVWQPRGDICKLIEQIQVTRRFKTGGFTVFNYGMSEAREILPLCGLGITRKQ